MIRQHNNNWWSSLCSFDAYRISWITITISCAFDMVKTKLKEKKKLKLIAFMFHLLSVVWVDFQVRLLDFSSFEIGYLFEARFSIEEKRIWKSMMITGRQVSATGWFVVSDLIFQYLSLSISLSISIFLFHSEFINIFQFKFQFQSQFMVHKFIHIHTQHTVKCPNASFCFASPDVCLIWMDFVKW